MKDLPDIKAIKAAIALRDRQSCQISIESKELIPKYRYCHPRVNLYVHTLFHNNVNLAYFFMFVKPYKP